MKPIIGIITCGFSNDRQFVSQSYIHAIEESGGVPLLIPCTRTESFYSFYHSICNGYLFCGGGDITPVLFGEDTLDSSGQTDLKMDRFQLSFMKYILSFEKPVLAICRGMQILNVALGGTIYQDISFKPGSSLQHMQNSLNRHDISHKVYFKKDSMLYKLFDSFTYTNSFHHQAIHELGSSLFVSGKTNDDIIEAIESYNHPYVIGVQWHPECMFRSSCKMRNLFSSFINASASF